MLNLFITVLITVFFLGKSSREIDEKTQKASWFRTFIYFFLTIIFAIFYYRSFQVETIINKIEINSLRGVEDFLQNSTDTVECIGIYNNFKTLGAYRNQYFEIAENREKKSIIGGVTIEIQNSDITPDSIKDRKGFNDKKRKDIEDQLQMDINSRTGEIFQYQFFSTCIPNFIPFYPIKKDDDPKVDKQYLYSTIDSIGNCTFSGDGKLNIAKSDEINGYFYNALLYNETMVAHTKDIKLRGTTMPHSLINTLNIFTAADLSQYSYIIELESDMYIKHLSVAYNVPIELTNQSDLVPVLANGFDIDNNDINKDILGNRSLMFHVKLPTMANLQEIRSLVLTAIVTALFSLFFSNLFYRLRKTAKKYILKHHVDVSEESDFVKHRVRDFIFLLYTIIFVVVVYIFVLVCFALFDYVFLIDYERDIWIVVLGQIFIICIFSAIIYYIYKKNVKPTSKKKEKKQ